MDTQTTYVALTKVTLDEKYLSDGIVERIDDLAYDHGAENHGSRLAYESPSAAPAQQPGFTKPFPRGGHPGMSILPSVMQRRNNR